MTTDPAATARNLLRLPLDRAEPLLVRLLVEAERAELRRFLQGLAVGSVLSGMGWALLGWLGVR